MAISLFEVVLSATRAKILLSTPCGKPIQQALRMKSVRAFWVGRPCYSFSYFIIVETNGATSRDGPYVAASVR